MGAAAVSVLTGVIASLITAVLRRRYEKQPAAWEKVFAGVAGGIAAALVAIALIKLAGTTDDDFGSVMAFAIGILLWFFALGGFGYGWASFEEVREAEREADKKPPNA